MTSQDPQPASLSSSVPAPSVSAVFSDVGSYFSSETSRLDRLALAIGRKRAALAKLDEEERELIQALASRRSDYDTLKQARKSLKRDFSSFSEISSTPRAVAEGQKEKEKWKTLNNEKLKEKQEIQDNWAAMIERRKGKIDDYQRKQSALAACLASLRGAARPNEENSTEVLEILRREKQESQSNLVDYSPQDEIFRSAPLCGPGLVSFCLPSFDRPAIVKFEEAEKFLNELEGNIERTAEMLEIYESFLAGRACQSCLGRGEETSARLVDELRQQKEARKDQPENSTQ